MQQESNSINIRLPLLHLSLSDVEMTDNGFKYLIQRFEAIYIQHAQHGREVEICMHLDISNNVLTEGSIKCFADILSKFNAFRCVKMNGIKKLKSKDNSYFELAKALKENTSLVELDLRSNGINEQAMTKILQALEYNFVLSLLKVDINLRKIPTGFS